MSQPYELPKGILAYRESRYDSAIAILSKVVQGQPQDWCANLYLAMAHERTGNTALATECIKKAMAFCADERALSELNCSLSILQAKMQAPLTMQPLAARQSVAAQARSLMPGRKTQPQAAPAGPQSGAAENALRSSWASILESATR